MASETEGYVSIVIFTAMAAVISVLVAVSGLLVALYHRGQAEGRLMEILSQLTKIDQDHESRIRTLESRSHPQGQ
jgi:signal transduction histidine kinase